MSDSILVIGGGIAGINCAMNAAKYGTKVYLIDDTSSIGGMMARLDKTFVLRHPRCMKSTIMKILKY